MTNRSRAYCFTINNYTPFDLEEVNSLEASCRYLVYGFEVGEERKTPHIQGYVYFTIVKSLRQVSAMLSRANLQAAKGSAEQNREYCTKEGNFHEFGEIPKSQKRKGVDEKERWADAKRCAIEGNIDDIPEDIYIRYYRTLKEIKKDHMVKPHDADGVTGVWLYGEAGAGKSRKARADYPDSYMKMCNKWWDGYQGEESVIIDDVDPNHKVLGHHLKIWSDRYAFLAETKGGAIMIRPSKIIVTSQYSIDQIFEDQETCAALLRRFDEIKII